MRRLLFLFIVFFISPTAQAQVDSLKKEFYSAKTTDNKNVKTCINLAKAYWKEQLDSAAVYTDLAYSLALKQNSAEGIAYALMQKAVVLNHKGKEKEALQNLQQAKKIVQQNGYKEIEASVYNGMGQAYKNHPDSALFYYNKSIKVAEELGLKSLAIKNKIRISLILLHQKKHQELAKLFDIIIPELEKAKDYDGLIETYTYMSLTFRDLNEKEKSLLYAGKALDLAPKVKDKKLRAFVYGAIGGGVTGYFESFEKSQPLVIKSLQLAIEINDKPFIKNTQKRLAILYCNNDKYDKAAPIIDSLLPGSQDPDVFRTKGIILTHYKKYAEADKFFHKAYRLYEQDKAYVQQRMTLLFKIDGKLEQLGNASLTDDFNRLDSLTIIIHETESKNQFFDLETKYRTAEKEAEIRRKELALAKSKNRTLLISGIALLILGVGIFSVWFLRNRQKQKELEHSNRLFELQNSLNVTELANLNNQLNPHEVKNLITSIAPELLTKAPDAYKKMIKLFNVTRASLSNKLTEPLKTQIGQAEDFLQLQQSISPYAWVFEIDNKAEDLQIELPRLLLKNMVENAVKHGMRSIKENGMIKIVISKSNQYLTVEIKDNGVGIEEDKNAERTGIGFSTYQKLFDFANAYNNLKASLALQRTEPWTSVIINIPLNYQYQ